MTPPIRRRGEPAAPPPLFEDLYVLGALSGAATLLLAGSFPVWGQLWEVVCPLREIVGIPCPTCYGTRAVLALLSGDVAQALRLNPLVALAGIGLLCYVPWATATVIGGWSRPPVSAALAVTLARLGGGFVVANWIYLLVAHP